MTFKPAVGPWLRLGVVFGVLLLGACSKSESPEQLMATARQELAANKFPEAILRLKSALQENPGAHEVRLLLGIAFERSGDLAAAAEEFNKARSAGVPQAVPLLLDVWLRSGQAKRVIETFKSDASTDAGTRAEIQAGLAEAYFALNDPAQGRKSLDNALALNSKCQRAQLLAVRLAAGKGDFANALAQLVSVEADHPNSYQLSNLRGDIFLRGLQDRAKAIESFRQSIALEPNDFSAYSGLLRAHVESGDTQALKADVEKAEKVFKRHPELMYYQIQLALAAGQYKAASEKGEALLGLDASNPRILMLAGIAEYRTGQYAAAENHLKKAVANAPDLGGARRVLAELYIGTGQHEKALTMLKPVLDSGRADGQALLLAAEAMMQSGDLEGARKMLTQANKGNPSDPSLQTKLALVQLAGGELGEGVRRLDSLASSDKDPGSDLALVTTYMLSGQFDKASQAVDRLASKAKDSPLPDFLRGKIAAQRGEFQAARTAWQQAAARSPAYYPLVKALAEQDFFEGSKAAGLERLAAFVQRSPKHARAALDLAEAKRANGAGVDEVVSAYEQAVRAGDGDVVARLSLIRFMNANGRVKQGLELAQTTAAEAPGNVDALELLGRSQLASGDAQQALVTSKKFLSAAPSRLSGYLLVEEIQTALNDRNGATQTLRQAKAIAPSSPQSARLLVDRLKASGRWDDALEVAKSVQRAASKGPLGFVLEGELRAAKRQWPEAIAAFKMALSLAANDTDLAAKYHAALSVAGKNAEAEAFSGQWVKSNPKDAGFLFYLGDLAMDRKAYALAENLYRKVTELAPLNAAALNNTAWLMVQQKKAGAAAVAEKARTLAPGSAAVSDTLALACDVEGQTEQGLAAAKRAVSLAPSTPQYRLRLAGLLLKSGDKAQARKELQGLADLGDKFAEQPEVARLLKTL